MLPLHVRVVRQLLLPHAKRPLLLLLLLLLLGRGRGHAATGPGVSGAARPI